MVNDPIARTWVFIVGLPERFHTTLSGEGKRTYPGADTGLVRQPTMAGGQSPPAHRYTQIVMRAAVLPRPGQPVVIEDLELDPPGPAEVRVRMLASGVCHSDLHVRDGEWDRTGPIVVGHEGAGVIEALGPGVDGATTGLKPGRLVALSWMVPCGVCRSCRAGRPWVCTDSPSFGYGRDGAGRTRAHRADGSDVLAYLGIGTMAEAQVVPEAAAIPMPEGTPAEVAALIGCCVATGVGAVIKTAEVPAGASVVVIGLGGVGLSAVMGARLAGAGRIVAVDRVPAKLERAAELGATHGILADADPQITAEAIRGVTDGGPDFAIEAIGRPATVELAIASLPPGGTAVLVGLTPLGERAGFDVFRFVDGGRRILGSNYGSTVAEVDFPRYAELYLAGRLPIERLIDRRIDLDGVEAAFDRMRHGEGVRSVIAF
jgi:S-(hydroxymethyl)glutathione dehydrogenase/alcohol dehydrogenase